MGLAVILWGPLLSEFSNYTWIVKSLIACGLTSTLNFSAYCSLSEVQTTLLTAGIKIQRKPLFLVKYGHKQLTSHDNSIGWFGKSVHIHRSKHSGSVLGKLKSILAFAFKTCLFLQESFQNKHTNLTSFYSTRTFKHLHLAYFEVGLTLTWSIKGNKTLTVFQGNVINQIHKSQYNSA